MRLSGSTLLLKQTQCAGWQSWWAVLSKASRRRWGSRESWGYNLKGGWSSEKEGDSCSHFFPQDSRLNAGCQSLLKPPVTREDGHIVIYDKGETVVAEDGTSEMNDGLLPVRSDNSAWSVLFPLVFLLGMKYSKLWIPLLTYSVLSLFKGLGVLRDQGHWAMLIYGMLVSQSLKKIYNAFFFFFNLGDTLSPPSHVRGTRGPPFHNRGCSDMWNPALSPNTPVRGHLWDQLCTVPELLLITQGTCLSEDEQCSTSLFERTFNIFVENINPQKNSLSTRERCRFIWWCSHQFRWAPFHLDWDCPGSIFKNNMNGWEKSVKVDESWIRFPSLLWKVIA